MPDVHSLVNECVTKLKKRKVEGSKATAKLTAELLRSFISQQRLPHSNQAGSLIDAVKTVGEKLIAANPVAESDDEDDTEHDDHPVLSATAVAAAARNALRPPSLQTLLEDIPHSVAAPHTSSSGGDSEGKSKSADKNSVTRKLKHNVIEAVNELIQDISTCHEQIAEQAVEHIHHNEVILTLGSSRTVMEFLCAAKEKKRSFRVFVAEGAPRYQGHALAKELASRGLQTTVITDSAVFAMISRVNMVIVGAHAVMANGGIIAPVGLNMVALAAQRHAVPFVVLAGVHKLCPLYPHNPEVLLNELKSPSELLDFGEFSDCLDFGSGTGSPLLHVVNPAFDYVPPNLVSLFITDTGGHNPSYMYRLIADYYSADDLVVRGKSAS
ncbi:UNVERIFIED_CONTAM: Translation initiation factor eIF-2B subunit beta [Sesamum latifolium]|uniref:Translation initiation factor eIF2B subunit beta n=1 Tax=Sesamum latifolium TaxID=2727402 RepID=A0AAW2YEZ4_9LAMI